MYKVKQMYRKEYVGESVTVDFAHKDHKWQATNEFIPNSVINNQISEQAVVIGNGLSRKEMDVRLLLNHFGGLLGAKKLQTYGCNALYRDFAPDFLVATGPEIVKEIAQSGYCQDHIVYTTANYILKYPGKFYLIPQNVPFNSGTVATYMACFDGHKKVYMFGMEGQDQEGRNYNMYAGTNGYAAETFSMSPNFWDLSMKSIFELYPDVDFVRVMPTANAFMPESWKSLPNVRQISKRDFVLEADL